MPVNLAFGDNPDYFGIKTKFFRRKTMPSQIDKHFSKKDLDRIARAVKEAEQHTSGEIVPYLVEASDGYEETLWRGAALSSLLVLSVAPLAPRFFSNLWFAVTPLELTLLLFGAGVIGALVTYLLSPIKRFLAGRNLMHTRVSSRTAKAFIAEEVFQTRDRSGILIFLSMFERIVIVVGDKGINEKVEKKDWEEIVDRIVKGIKDGSPADGLVDAIYQCRALLQI